MKRQILKDFTLTEISGVDKPAQPTAKMTIMKRDLAPETIAKSFISDDGNVYAKDFSSLLNESTNREKIWEAREELWPLFNALNDSISSIVLDKTISDKMPRIELAVNNFVSAVRDKIPDVEEELLKFFDDIAGASGVINPDDTGDKPMPDVKKTADELQTELETVTKSVAELTEKLATAETLSKMSDDEKSYLEKAAGKDKEDFMAMSPEDRKKKMASMKKNDETVEVAGQTISKSAVGDAQFAIFKAQADEMAEIRKQAKDDREAAEKVTLEKRANDEIGNLPGAVDAKGRVLKALDGLSADDRKVADQMFKAANEALAKSTETLGVVDGEVEKSAKDAYANAISEIRKRDNVSELVANETLAVEKPELIEAIRG